jgi:hypothetical protein
MDAFVQTLVRGGLPSNELEDLLTKYGLREDPQMKTILQNLKWREEPQPSTSRQTEEPMKV